MRRLSYENSSSKLKKLRDNKNKMKTKNKKAVMNDLLKIILWIVFFGIGLLALYFLFKRFGVLG